MIKRDKILHFLVGIGIFLPFAYLFNPLVGFAITFIAGVGKEIYDSFYPLKHTSDFWDIMATITVPFMLLILENLYG